MGWNPVVSQRGDRLHDQGEGLEDRCREGKESGMALRLREPRYHHRRIPRHPRNGKSDARPIQYPRYAPPRRGLPSALLRSSYSRSFLRPYQVTARTMWRRTFTSTVTSTVPRTLPARGGTSPRQGYFPDALLPRQEYLTRERGWRRIDGREVDVRM